MKKKYIKPEITVISTQTESLLASASGSGSSNSATYGNDGEHGQTGNIGTAGDGDDFTMESKGNNLWEDEWD